MWAAEAEAEAEAAHLAVLAQGEDGRDDRDSLASAWVRAPSERLCRELATGEAARVRFERAE